MTLDSDDEILQDFIIEAGEIIELLSGQLVQLEKNPTDTALLNAIFRGFHTIKGGAGFLSLTNLVNICHVSENVFDHLRQGKRKVDAGLMDLILKSVDCINNMFSGVKEGKAPEPAEKSLLDNLESLIKNTNISSPIPDSSNVNKQAPLAQVTAKDTVEQETETKATSIIIKQQDESTVTTIKQVVKEDEIKPENVVIKEVETKKSATLVVESNKGNVNPTIGPDVDKNDKITEKEFDNMLDTMYGSRVTKEITANTSTVTISNSDDEITEEEFEKLLDTLSDKKQNSNSTVSDIKVTDVKTVNTKTNVEKPAASNIEEVIVSQSSKIDNKKTESTVKETPITNVTTVVTEEPPSTTQTTETVTDDLITEEEFELLLDELAGKTVNKGITKTSESATTKLTAKEEHNKQNIITKQENISAVTNSISPAIVEKDNHEESIKQIEPSPTIVVEQKSININPEESIKNEVHKEKEDAAKDDLAKKETKSTVTNMETTVRVDTNRLDQIMNMVGELVLVRNRLVKLKNNSNNQDIVKTVGTLDLVTADLQVAVMKTRMQPIKKVFGRFPRVVRDLARSLKKEIVLEMIGEDTDLDKNLVEALADPLVHLVRNSVDHGIELPDIRVKAGKPKAGKIVLSAAQEGDHIMLSIEDDGKGMDPDELRKSAVEKGVLSQEVADRLSDNECFELIFIPGFSTKKEISDISGRGVGMDVVKTRIVQLNGSVDIVSMLGKGSKINIKVPLTLAILPTLMVIVGNQPFALPLACVNEIFDLNVQNTNIVDGQLVVVVRNKAMPLFYLREWLIDDKDAEENDALQHVVVVSVGMQKIGFVVDKLLGQEEVVIKALGDMLHGTGGIAGATITGDGNIAVILDVPSLLKKYADKNRKAICL